MGLGKLFQFDSHGTEFKKNMRRTADGARFVLEWLWNNPQLAGNILSLAGQTIPGAGTAVSAGFSAAGKAIEMGKKLTEGTDLSSKIDEAQAKLKIIQKK
jgi:hypothetical protein